MIKLGTITLNHGLILAPMAGTTDLSFRRICRRFGAEMTVTEMVSAKALHYRDSKTDRIAALDEGEAPAAVQIFGSEPDIMAEAAAMLASGSSKPAVIDINMGCPMKKIVGNGEGSRLMQNPALAGKIIRAVSDAISIPVTVKFRTGWDETSKNAPEFARVCEASGADAICIHGRTREQMYAPPVDLQTIAEVKRAVSIPVIGNGDVMTAADAIEMFSKTGVDGVAVARGSMGNPWIFDEIKCRLEGREFCPPTTKERLSVALEHLDSMIREKGLRVGICEGRRQLSYYIAGLPGAAAARDAINRAQSREEIGQILNALFDT